MSNNNITTTYLSDYKPAAFDVETVRLEFDLFDDQAIVRNCMRLVRHHPGALYLYGDSLELLSVAMDGVDLIAGEYQVDKDGLTIINCPAAEVSLTITTRIRPQDNTSLSGLYRSNQLFCTQCEAEGFRRITFFPDRPDVLAIYTTKITADKAQYPVLLSNGNLLKSGDTDDGRHWVVWQDPFKKPSYLFALVAGDLACVTEQFITCSGREVALRLYVDKGNEDKCAHALTSLKHAMRWDEEEYGREYDLDIFMIVAVHDFNMGAMENKGLNLFNAKYVLARPDMATDQDYADIEGVVAHEYFHNWTGNRVTCRDWFQLSLKEGLTVFRDQEFSRDMNSRDVQRILDVQVLRNTQFPEDASSMAHPVQPASYQEINNFYTATIYNKGAEVIRMQQTLLSKNGFRRGMDLYFERHDGQAVTINDFVAAMEDANQVDFTQFKLWYTQAGTPVVQVDSTFQDNCLTLTLRQSCAPTAECTDKQAFHMPINIALFTQRGEQLAIIADSSDNQFICTKPPQENAIAYLDLYEREQSYQFHGLSARPIVSLLRDFSAPIILQQDLSTDALLALLKFETDGFVKWDAAMQLARGCIIQLMHSKRADWAVSDTLIAAYRHVLNDESIDHYLRAILITPPSFEEIVANLTAVDVALVEDARDFYRAAIGRGLSQILNNHYTVLWQAEDNAMNKEAYGRRKLRNVCLWLMMKADESNTIYTCEKKFLAARNMTDLVSSFSLIVNSSDIAMRERVIDVFYSAWKDEPLAIDKWLAIQASSEHKDALAHVQALLTHPVFSIKNPNKVRALIGTFAQANPRNFHAADGSGYAFLTEQLLHIDAINPQIAARIATPFTRAQCLDPKRRALIKTELLRLSKADLSRNLQELVSKSL